MLLNCGAGEDSWTARRSNQSILNEINPEYSLKGMILKIQYFGHHMGRANSLEKTLMLGKTEGRRRRGLQRMRWWNGITKWVHVQQTLGVGEVKSLSRIRLFATPWTAACQAPLSFTVSWNLLKFMSIESVMPSNHLILCPLLLLSSVFPSIRVFSNELALPIRWPKYWSFNISLSNEYSGLRSNG